MPKPIVRAKTYRCPDCEVSWQEDIAIWDSENQKWDYRPDEIPVHLHGCRFAAKSRRKEGKAKS